MSSRTTDLTRAAVEIARTAGVLAAERLAAGTTASLKPDGTGGRVTDLAGGDVLAGAGDVLISNGRIHDQLLDLVAGLPTGPRPRPS